MIDMQGGMFSSKTDMWETPQDLFDRLNHEFHFTLDVCAIPENAKCSNFFSPENDGLSQEWFGTCWMNPPYGKEIGKWVKKAYEFAVDRGGAPSYACFRRVQIQNGGMIIV